MLTVTYVFLIASIVAILASIPTPQRVPLWVGCALLWVVVALMVLPK